MSQLTNKSMAMIVDELLEDGLYRYETQLKLEPIVLSETHTPIAEGPDNETRVL